MTQAEQETVQEAQEVVKDQEANSSPDGELIAESKKYRIRAQKAEAKIAEMEKTNEADRNKQLEEQEEWKTLAEERKAKIDNLTPIVDKYKADESKYMEELLSDFSDEDRETFKELPIKQLRTVHSKLIQKKTVPTTDSSAPGDTKGYTTVTDAAKAFSRGEIDENAWQKIRRTFADKINR